MDKLTIEEKAKAYDEAIKRVENIKTGKCKTTFMFTEGLFEHIFPELKENEDEGICRKLIAFLRQCRAVYGDGFKQFGLDIDDALAWLEKQGEQKSVWHNEDEEPQRDSLILLVMQSGTPIVAKIIEPNHIFNHGERWAYIDDLLEKQGEHARFIEAIQVGDKVTRNEDGVLVNLSQLKRVAKPAEVQGEQKPADKVETKFHEGDWVILTAGELSTTLQIVKVDTNKRLYWFNDSSYLPIVDEECLHLWTIQDAKAGDVLAAHECLVLFKEIDGLNIRCYCTYHYLNHEAFYVDTLQNKTAFHPATKEQRNLLFQKMKEAGYEWDAEKKELKKIEQKPAWSEEDELHIRELESLVKQVWATAEHGNDKDTIHKMSDLSFFLKTLKPQLKQEWSEEDEILLKLSLENLTELKDRFGEYYGRVGGCIDWLKSLKQRYTLKASDEHYELEEFAKIVRGNLTGISKAVQKLFEAKYLQLTGNKMYGGYKD